MHIYVDGLSVYANLTNNLDTFVPLAAGSHAVVVKAWDSSGAIFQVVETITVVSGTTTGTGAVNVTSPVNAAQVGSPFQVVATASAPKPITQMAIYLDSNLVFSGKSASVNTPVTAGAGTHSVVVQAWDSGGTVYKKPLTVTVGSSTPPVVTGTVIDNIEQSPWLTCGACGNNGGTGSTAPYFDTLGIASPSEDGNSTKFTLAATVPFTNGYFYQVHTPIATGINALVYEFDLFIPAGSETLPQAIEFECQQVLQGWVYNFAWQAVYPSSAWRTFDYGLKRWDTSGIPFVHFSPNTWHHLVAEYHNNTANHTVVHDALTVDGVRHVAGIVHNAFFSGAVNNQFTNAFQLDSNSVAADYSTFVDKMKITWK